MPRVDILRYGNNEIGTPEFSSGGCWVRYDTYTSHETGQVFRERHFCNGPQDTSPAFQAGYWIKGDEIGAGQYAAECSSCWLHFSHTLDYHNMQTKAEVKSC